MYRVLLVDDEILVRDAIRENIDWNKLGYELAGDCQNGREAVAFVKENPVDVVLTDICMPYVDGMELSHFLHDNYPSVQIIIFSGFGEFEYAKKAIQYKVSEYLLKPVTAVELSEVLTRIREKLKEGEKEEQKLERLTSASEKYQKNMQLIRSQLISSLVLCTQDVPQCLKELESLDVHIESDYYRVGVLSIDLYSDFYDLTEDQRKESALMAFVVFNITDEIVKEYDAGIAYQETNNRIGILFRTNRPKEFTHVVTKIGEKIQSKVYDAMKLDVSLCVGPYVRSLEKLHVSYKQADQALAYRYLLGGKLYLDLNEDENFEREVFLFEQLGKIPEIICRNREQEIENLLDEIDGKIKAARVNKSRACLALQQVVRTISEVMEKVHPDPQQVQERRNLLLSKIAQQKIFSKAMALVGQYARETADYMAMENSSASRRQAFQAREYIEEHYADADLGLNDICSYLGISTSYFSTIIKELSGKTFMEQLTQVRMEKAKELLEHTALKNYEIAERVGFADPHYFGIAFKKMTGKTPTEYAKEKRR